MLPTGLRSFLERDPPRLRFGLATAAAAWLAIVLAAALDLPNGHWAGVTVLTVSQPTRGLLFEKCLWRLVGTTAGALMGIGLLAAFATHPAAALVGLTENPVAHRHERPAVAHALTRLPPDPVRRDAAHNDAGGPAGR